MSSLIQCVLAFCVPAVILAKYCDNKSFNWLYLKNAPSFKSIIGVILIYITSLPAMEWLIEWNAGLHLPQSMQSLEKVLRAWEESGESITTILLSAQGILNLIIGILVIGVVTGFSEELFFRGALQGIFTRANIRITLAVWLTAIIFSTMHFQFFGFVPRLIMGVFFGYLLVWSRSLWVPIFAHALNNSLVVYTAWTMGGENLELSNQNTSMFPENLILVLASVLTTVLILIFFRDFLFKSDKGYNKSWRRKQQPRVIER